MKKATTSFDKLSTPTTSIEHHPTPNSTVPLGRTATRGAKLGVQAFGRELVAVWQPRGPETLSGNALRKLRLSYAPPQVVIDASAAG